LTVPRARAYVTLRFRRAYHMADQIPEQSRPAEESKKDTVRINLPPGLTGRGAAPGGPAPPPGARIISTPSPATASPEEEAKKETAVLGRAMEAPKPKKDTSRVQVTTPKPASPEAQRPGVKLRRDEPAPASGPSPAGGPAAAAPARMAPMAAAAPSGANAGLSVVAMILSIVLAGYLAWLTFG
jgi:hypothetical protein